MRDTPPPPFFFWVFRGASFLVLLSPNMCVFGLCGLQLFSYTLCVYSGWVQTWIYQPPTVRSGEQVAVASFF